MKQTKVELYSYNEKKAAKRKALKEALEQHCFYILREYTWLANTYWEIGY